MGAIGDIIASVLKLIVDWPQRKAAAARKNYAIWRNEVKSKQEERARRAALLDSVDDLTVCDNPATPAKLPEGH